MTCSQFVMTSLILQTVLFSSLVWIMFQKLTFFFKFIQVLFFLSFCHYWFLSRWNHFQFLHFDFSWTGLLQHSFYFFFCINTYTWRFIFLRLLGRDVECLNKFLPWFCRILVLSGGNKSVEIQSFVNLGWTCSGVQWHLFRYNYLPLILWPL